MGPVDGLHIQLRKRSLSAMFLDEKEHEEGNAAPDDRVDEKVPPRIPIGLGLLVSIVRVEL